MESQAFSQKLETRKESLQKTLAQSLKVIEFYENEGKVLSEQILDNASKSYKEGEIDFLQYVQLLENSNSLTLQYLESKLSYELNLLEIQYLTLP